MQSTGVDAQNELERQFMAQWRKAGLIIDERFNSGGQIPDRFIELLNRPALSYWAVRDGAPRPWPPVGHRGPSVMLINGWSGSGGDAFPFYFREAKLGPLIGTRTWGGLIGISGAPALVDGGGVTVPTFRMFDLRGSGSPKATASSPIFPVDEDPAQLAEGEDPAARARDSGSAARLQQSPGAPKHPAVREALKRIAVHQWGRTLVLLLSGPALTQWHVTSSTGLKSCATSVRALLQRLREIGNQVLGMLQPHGNPEEVLRRLRQRAFDRGAVLDERLGAAEARGARDQLQARRQCEGLRAAAPHTNATASRRPRASDAPRRRARDSTPAPGNTRARSPGGREEPREPARALDVAAHAVRQRADAAQHEPAVERRRHGARPRSECSRTRAKKSSASRAMTTPPRTSLWPPRYFVVECITRSAPSVERPLQDRGRPRVVDDEPRARRGARSRQRPRCRSTCSRGFDGVSTQTSRVAERTAARWPPDRSCRTNVVCRPHRAK